MNSKGFSLIELIITIAIIGILAAVAFPAYQDSVAAGRRGDCQATLLSFAQAMERLFTTSGTYALADGNAGNITASTAPATTLFADEAPLDGTAKYCDLRIMLADSTSYTLRAIPKNAHAGDGFSQLASTGQKSWDRNNNGSIAASEACWSKSC